MPSKSKKTPKKRARKKKNTASTPTKRSASKTKKKTPTKRKANPSGAPALSKVPDEIAELGRVVDIYVERPDGQIEQHAWRGRNPLLLWDAKQKAILFVYRLKHGRPRKVHADGTAAHVYEKWSGFEADTERDVSIPVVRLKKIGRALSIGYRSDKFEGKLKTYDHPHGAKVSVYYAKGPRGEKVYAIRGGSLRVTSRGIEG